MKSTSIPGQYSYIGYADEYGRSVQLNLTVNKKPEPIRETKIGFVERYFEKGGNLYIVFDEVKFYKDEEARQKKLKMD